MSVPRVSSLSTLSSRLMAVFDIAVVQSGARKGSSGENPNTGPLVPYIGKKLRVSGTSSILILAPKAVLFNQMHSDHRPQ